MYPDNAHAPMMGALMVVHLIWRAHLALPPPFRYGADVKMIVPWIILIGVITGATGVISFMEVLA